MGRILAQLVTVQVMTCIGMMGQHYNKDSPLPREKRLDQRARSGVKQSITSPPCEYLKPPAIQDIKQRASLVRWAVERTDELSARGEIGAFFTACRDSVTSGRPGRGFRLSALVMAI